MKGLIVLLLFLLVGCASGPTLDELEKQALASGDWSAVESRERMIQRREMRAGLQCPTGYASLCTVMYGDKRCNCVPSRAINSLVAGF